MNVAPPRRSDRISNSFNVTKREPGAGVRSSKTSSSKEPGRSVRSSKASGVVKSQRSFGSFTKHASSGKSFKAAAVGAEFYRQEAMKASYAQHYHDQQAQQHGSPHTPQSMWSPGSETTYVNSRAGSVQSGPQSPEYERFQRPLRPAPLVGDMITIAVGLEPRMFAAHVDVLNNSPYLARLIQTQAYRCENKEGTIRFDLPAVDPEVFSAVLEYLYKGDYFPRMVRGHKQWEVDYTREDGTQDTHGIEYAVDIDGERRYILKDTVVYITALRFGLDELCRLALRKQGLHQHVAVPIILNSARFAYDNTPDDFEDQQLRAHFIACVIRSRSIFRQSGTMQDEMVKGGKLFFDVFVAMANHIDDLNNMIEPGPKTPRSSKTGTPRSSKSSSSRTPTMTSMKSSLMSFTMS